VGVSGTAAVAVGAPGAGAVRVEVAAGAVGDGTPLAVDVGVDDGGGQAVSVADGPMGGVEDGGRSGVFVTVACSGPAAALDVALRSTTVGPGSGPAA